MPRSAFTPAVSQRQLVLKLAACGTSVSEICALVTGARGRPVTEQTLRAHFAQELLEGAVRANSNVAQSLYNKATGGDTIAAIFWLKCRARWKETAQAVELSGANGGPLLVQSMTDAELEAIVAKGRQGRRARRS
ncbi:hypothetical protein NOV72_05751 [Caballeronia novacaledonica]|uniref:Uncharacterized protein n=1 Tax=Caballeronia novacaledonica TaxID=1544861 RepID=A0A2U3IEB9_9BURK|nr:hypothetical protein [Caballeronia novacaledonica]SPB18551.1 hypothetical protein NOV72_05751 [Caballeronia novacaledonica]